MILAVILTGGSGGRICSQAHPGCWPNPAPGGYRTGGHFLAGCQLRAGLCFEDCLHSFLTTPRGLSENVLNAQTAWEPQVRTGQMLLLRI